MEHGKVLAQAIHIVNKLFGLILFRSDPACQNGPFGIGNVPTITDCDGDGTVELVSNDVSGDTWYFQATCATGVDESCVANCSADGCIFCNEELTYSNGAWEDVCSSDSHCQ